MNQEQFYDEIITPKLLEITELCKSMEIGFMAITGFNGSHGQVSDFKDSDYAMLMAHYAIASKGNIDVFMMNIEKLAIKNGHSSIYLTLRGIPTIPESVAQQHEPIKTDE